MDELTGIGQILQQLNLVLSSDEELPTMQEMENLKADAYNETVGDMDKVDGYNCKRCRNKGMVAREYEVRPGYWSNELANCECMTIRKTIRSMQKSGLKNIIKDYTFDKFDDDEEWQTRLKKAAILFADDPKGWFFIGGQSGAGKTHLCTAICRKLLLEGREVKYMLWRDEVVRLKSLVNESEEYSRIMEAIKTAEVLYIDDLFKTGKGLDGDKQRPTGADINIAFEVFNFRYNNQELITIISSECTMADIADIDEAVAGRIFERAKAFSIKPDKAKNHRLKSIEL